MSVDDEDTDRYREAIDGLVRVLDDPTSLGATLDQLLAVAASAAPGVAALTVTAIAEDGVLASASSTDDHARAVDEREFALREGPCIAALETGEEQLVRDTTRDGRWPRFEEVARQNGFGSAAGLPLRTPSGTTVGSLNAFHPAAGGLTEEALVVLRRVCPSVAAVLANARAHRSAADLRDRLTETLASRAMVHRAVGVRLGQDGGDPEAVLATLQREAEGAGRSLVEHARRVVEGSSRP